MIATVRTVPKKAAKNSNGALAANQSKLVIYRNVIAPELVDVTRL